ncbi:TPA: tetratricopeptide repeat protein [Proteus mirabilis]
MKIFNILFFGLLIISNSSIGDEYPIITDKMLSSGYNKLELQYDPQLPLITPYPENKELVYPLIDKAKKNNNSNDSYLIASIFFVGCTNLKYKITHESDKNQCELSRNFLKKTLALNPKHGAALFYQAVIFENGYGVEKDISKAIKYYDKACRIKGNKVIIACENLFSIYLHGNKGVPQDLKKAKEYAKWIAENGSQKYQEYIKRWDYILFSLELSLKLKECKKSGINASICIRKSNNALLEYANKMYPIE